MKSLSIPPVPVINDKPYHKNKKRYRNYYTDIPIHKYTPKITKNTINKTKDKIGGGTNEKKKKINARSHIRFQRTNNVNGNRN